MNAIVLHFEAREIQPRPQESVLDALLRAGIDTPFSCKGGSCHTCMLQCTQGDVPAAAQRGLSEALRAKGYFLPCRCEATGPMRLRPRQPQDMVTRCLLVEVEGHALGALRIQFEPLGSLAYRTGQSLRLVTGAEPEPRLQLASEPGAPVLEAHWTLRPGEQVPPSLAPDAEFGTEFEVRGPFSADHDEIPEMPAPAPDPGLWEELGHGRMVRTVLEDFYARVYADPLLSPFFIGRVTQERIVGKQYSFLEQCFTGAKVFWGESPRNTHHWMVIPHSLFDHRQRLMEDTQHAHGLSAEQMRRWNHYEEYFRPDIVKDREWPRRDFDGQLQSLEGFDTLNIDSGTLCDTCGAEVPAGTAVTYHRRTGRISCPQCAPGA